MTLTDLCQELKNWFVDTKHFGEFTIENGELQTDFLKQGQFFRIIGSTFNDGVYQFPNDPLINETFDGAVWALAIPKAVLCLAKDIAEYEEINKKELSSPYQSESFGGYSYSKATDLSWKARFKEDLNRWRKV